MAKKLLHKGQSVYAADGTYLGRLLQCDPRFIVIGGSRWKPDHWIVSREEVAAAASDIVMLRSLADALPPETAEPWWPAPDHLGNADGIDLEPLRAGMAEMDDKRVGTWRPPVDDLSGAPVGRSPPPFPSPEDVDALDRERIERLDVEVEKLIAAEIEDLELGAACARPPGLELPPGECAGFVLDPLEPALLQVEPVLRPIAARQEPDQARARVPELTAAGEESSRTPRTLERALRAAGFSVDEAHAIAARGFRGLGALHRPRVLR